MTEEVILISEVSGIATISLNRVAKRNAMNAEMIRALLKALNQFSTQQDIRMIIIRGEGEHFCAGADITNMQKMATASYSENYDDAQLLADLMYQLYHFPKPTLALAQGVTLGGGLGLLAACDIAIAAENASFGFSEVKLGIVPSVVSPYVIKAIGERAAHYYFLTGERFNAALAHQIGLIHQVTTLNALMSTGLAIAQMILTNAPQALVAAKQLIRHVTKDHITEELAQKTAEHLAHLRASNEAQEGLKAFLEKRAPKWE